MPPAANGQFEAVRARKRDGLWDVIGLCAAHDEGGPPLNHRVPDLANLVIAGVGWQDDLAFQFAFKLLDGRLGEASGAFFISISSSRAEGLEVGGVQGRGAGAGRRFRFMWGGGA